MANGGRPGRGGEGGGAEGGGVEGSGMEGGGVEGGGVEGAGGGDNLVPGGRLKKWRGPQSSQSVPKGQA